MATGSKRSVLMAAEKGMPNGVAALDGDGKVPASQIPQLTDAQAPYYDMDFLSQAAAHNSIIRHKVLTDTRTLEQILADLANNDVSDIYAGDFIDVDTPAISETGFAAATAHRYVILEINGLKNFGYPAPSGNHLVMAPLLGLGSAKMNDTDTITGGYVGSKMYTVVMPAVVTALESAFGSSHIMTTKETLINTTNDTYASMAGANFQGASVKRNWYGCKARLCSEVEVCGVMMWGSSVYDSDGVPSQFPAFRDPFIRNPNPTDWWLSGVACSGYFCVFGNSGSPTHRKASTSCVVRPRFCIQ